MSRLRNLRNARARAARSTPPGAPVDGTAGRIDTATVERVAKLTGMARTSWLGLLSYLAFVGITLLGVQDADFFITERETDLPLVGVSVPTNLFFYVAPVLGALLYVHMHLYLLKLWKALDELPDGPGVKAEEAIAPWIVSDMALARVNGHVHAYPLRTLTRGVVVLSIFVLGPFVLAAFWWRSMPKHDELLTVIFCGVPLFFAVLAGVESWLALRRGGSRPRHMPRPALAGWVMGLLGLSAVGFLTTEGTLGHYARIDRIKVLGEEWEFASLYERQQAALEAHLETLDAAELRVRFAGITNHPDPDYPEELDYLAERELVRRWWRRTWWPGLLRPAQLSGVVLVETPPDWRPRDEAEQRFRAQWCADQGIPKAVCGAGPLARDDDGERLPVSDDLTYPRQTWCEEERGKDPEACSRYFEELDRAYAEAWPKARRDALAALPRRVLGGADLRGAVLRQARMEGADLWKARMEGADLSEARMQGAVLSEARMEGADLRWARMDENTSFQAATLRGAVWKEVTVPEDTLTQAQVNETFGDASVTLPGLTRPDHWPDWEGYPWTFQTNWQAWRDDPEGYSPPPAPGD